MNENLNQKVRKRLAGKEWEPKILAFCCNWCSYAGADAAGLERRQVPPTIRVMCSGRIDPAFVLMGILEGADAVLVTGCHTGDCHYVNANYEMRNRYEFLNDFVEISPVAMRDFGLFRDDEVEIVQGTSKERMVFKISDLPSNLIYQR